MITVYLLSFTKLKFVQITLHTFIYMLSVFTEKPYSKPFERNVFYIPITTSNHATSVTSK